MGSHSLWIDDLLNGTRVHLWAHQCKHAAIVSFRVAMRMGDYELAIGKER